jgi:uncharacterized protein YggE
MLEVTSKGEGRTISSWLGDSRNIVAVIVSAIALMIVWVWYSNPLVITVTGTGEVSVPAQNATLSFIVSSSSANINDAIGGVNTKATQVKTAISSFGIGEEDITQTQVSVIPPALIGSGAVNYSATITLTAKVSDYSIVNSLISTLYAKGADYVSQPVLSVDDPAKLESQALSLAMKDASKKANEMSLKSLKFLKKRVVLTQVSSPTTSSTTTKTTPAQADITTPTTGDSFKVTKVVSVTYKMW